MRVFSSYAMTPEPMQMTPAIPEPRAGEKKRPIPNSMNRPASIEISKFILCLKDRPQQCDCDECDQWSLQTDFSRAQMPKCFEHTDQKVNAKNPCKRFHKNPFIDIMGILSRGSLSVKNGRLRAWQNHPQSMQEIRS